MLSATPTVSFIAFRKINHFSRCQQLYTLYPALIISLQSYRQYYTAEAHRYRHASVMYLCITA